VKAGDMLRSRVRLPHQIYQWFSEEPVLEETPGVLEHHDIVVYTGVKKDNGLLRVVSKLGIGWISKDYLVKVP
jgi:hypothetical protein